MAFVDLASALDAGMPLERLGAVMLLARGRRGARGRWR